MINANLIRHRFVRIYQSYFPKPLSEYEHEMIKAKLGAPLVSLFYSQPLCDQRHGLLVYEKCKEIFANIDAPNDEELFFASCFHDLAKKDCRFSVSQRIIVAMILGLIPVKQHENLRSSSSKLLRRIGIYVDHADISWNMVKDYTDSKFVYGAIAFHHGYPKDFDIDQVLHDDVARFIAADTL